MKFKRPALARTVSAIVGGVGVASALALAPTAAHASSPITLQWCDEINSSPGIDAWSGSTWLGVLHGGCTNNEEIQASGEIRVDFFLNNEPAAFNIGHVYLYPGANVTVLFYGNLNSISESVSNN